MSQSDQLLSEIESFLSRTGMAASTFGQKALTNSKLVARLRSGGTVTLDTAEEIRAFIAQNGMARRSRKGNDRVAA